MPDARNSNQKKHRQYAKSNEPNGDPGFEFVWSIYLKYYLKIRTSPGDLRGLHTGQWSVFENWVPGKFQDRIKD